MISINTQTGERIIFKNKYVPQMEFGSDINVADQEDL